MICKYCGKEMRIRQGKNGSFWGCSGYPNCKNTAPIEQKPKEAFYTSPEDYIARVPQGAPKQEPQEKVDWDAINRRVVRMNALTHATEAIKAIYPMRFKDNDVLEDTFAQLVIKIAEEYETWIYRPIEPNASEIGFKK